MVSTQTKIIIVVLFLMFGLLAVGGYELYKDYHNRLVALENARKQAQKPAEQVKITLLEGWTIADMGDYLEKKSLGKSELYQKAASEYDHKTFDFLTDIPPKHDLEGYLFPDTYLIEAGAAPKAIITKQLSNFNKKLQTLNLDTQQVNGGYVYKIPGYEKLGLTNKNGLTLYEVVSLASIVEKETGIDLGKLGQDQVARLEEERKIIAGIFLNRLAIGQALESDATINYITGKSDAQASSQDLASNSPYNTYRFNGLPPGPIANPSLSSIESVLHPTKTDYYYFFHKQPSGEAVYSKTFEEHREKRFRFLK